MLRIIKHAHDHWQITRMTLNFIPQITTGSEILRHTDNAVLKYCISSRYRILADHVAGDLCCLNVRSRLIAWSQDMNDQSWAIMNDQSMF